MKQGDKFNGGMIWFMDRKGGYGGKGGEEGGESEGIGKKVLEMGGVGVGVVCIVIGEGGSGGGVGLGVGKHLYMVEN